MKMQKRLGELKDSSVSFKDWIIRNKIALVLGCAVALLIFVGGQKACDSYRETQENERIKEIERQAAEREQTFKKYIDMANTDHATTTAILDTMASVTRDINELREQDKAIESRIESVVPEYKAARRQSNNQSAIQNGRNRLTGEQLRRKENELLKADSQLYPER